VRSKMAAEVNRGKENVAGQLEAAKKEIEGSVSQLAVEIARRVLQPAATPGGPAREMR
jgi:flagellar biosynthesis/type III secretory pathway protein FliH